VVFSLDSDPKGVRKTSSSACSKHKKRKKGQKHHRNPVILAKEWKEAIESGEYKSRADLARGKGISRARVTQILNLLKLDSEVQETVVRLGDPLKSSGVTERRLRGMVGLSSKEQMGRLKGILFKR